jgi:N-acetylneuraminate synthase
MNGSDITTINKSLIIADVAQAHDGSLGFAHAFIDAAAKTGIDGIKFQTHIADAESTPAEPWRVKFSRQDETRYDYWKRMEFREHEWEGLRKHAEGSGLQFLSTPFSMEAFQLLQRVGVSAWKVGSGEVTNAPLLEAMAKTGLPVILSSGMSSLAETDAAVAIFKQNKNDLTILQCSTTYPCPPEQIGLNMLPVFRERYSCKVGLSDHSGTIYPSLAAVTLGAQMIEVHVTLNREMFGPDVSSSLTTSELKQLVEGIRIIEKILMNPIDKDSIAIEKKDLKIIFGKSIVAARDLPEGTILSNEHLTLKKPGTGLDPQMLKTVIGRTLKRQLQVNQQLSKEDYE